MEIINLIIIAANIFFSYKGFSNPQFFENYSFNVEKILVYKEYKRLITSGFLHVSWMHLIFNMFSLYIFSGSLETAMGGLNFLIIYFASLIGGNLLSLFIHRHHPEYSAVGASGAVSGIIFASIALFPGMSIGLFPLPFSIPAWIYGILYVLYSIYGIRSKSDNVGHDAHLGGGLVGLLIAVIMHPESIRYNYIPILLIAIPAAVFIYFIITRPGFLLIDSHYFNKHNFYSIDHKYNSEKHNRQKELDQLLDKINRKGLNSLSQKEKERLESLSK